MAITWSVSRKAVIRGQTDVQPRRSCSKSSSFRIRVGEEVT